MDEIKNIMNDFKDLFNVNNNKHKFIFNQSNMKDNSYNMRTNTNTKELFTRIFKLGWLIGQSNTILPSDEQYIYLIKQIFTEPINIRELLYKHADYLLLYENADLFIPLIQLLNGELSIEQSQSQPFSFDKCISIATDYINNDIFNQYVIGKYIEGLQTKQLTFKNKKPNSDLEPTDNIESIINAIEDSSINNNYNTVRYNEKYTYYQQNRLKYNESSDEYTALEKKSINTILKCLLIQDALIYSNTGIINTNTAIKLQST